MLDLSHRDDQGGLAGKTLGIIGYGALGTEVSRRAEAFGMKILVNQPRLTPELALEPGIQSLELADLLKHSDVVCLFLPSNPETVNMINHECLALMKPGSFLINAGSADVIRILDLENNMRKGIISSAAIRISADAPYFPPEDLNHQLTVFHFSPPPNNRTEIMTANRIMDKIIRLLQKRQAGSPISLQVVPVENIYPHEHFDPERVTDLADRLVTAETLVNPPVVAEWDGKYVVLDGATRTTAFRKLRYPHIVVQVVSPSDDQIRLHTWYHALHGLTLEEILTELEDRKTYSLVPVSPQQYHTPIDSAEAICSIYCDDGRRFRVVQAPGTEFLSALNDLVTDYTSLCHIHRTLSTDFTTLRNEIDSVVALVVFPQFEIEEVLQAAVSETLLPAGITRFVIPGRVLRLNADMEILRSGQSQEEKNTWLDQLLSDKLARRRVRYYQEPVFLLDE